MKTTDFITEHNAFIAQDAGEMHTDHEMQMARADCYHAADYAIKLHKLLAQANENGNLEGWVSEKITLANDYLRTVYEYLSYEDQEVDLHAMPTFAFESAEAQMQAELNEVNPHNFDSDVDYYAAVNAPAKPRYRGTQSPGVNPDDEDYFREIFRKKRLAAQQAEKDKEQGIKEGFDVVSVLPGAVDFNYNGLEFEANKGMPGNHSIAGLSSEARNLLRNKKFAMLAQQWLDNYFIQGVAEGKQTVSEMTAGGTGAGGFATGPAGGTGKPGTGKPKKLGNIVRRTTPKIGTGIYK